MLITEYYKNLLKEYIKEVALVEIFNKKYLTEAVETISWEEARELIRATKGKIFTVTFRKRSDGATRLMNCRLGVKKYLHGGELPYWPDDHNLVPVFDLKKNDYRMISANTLVNLKIGSNVYNIQ
jgi:hypothetical protein